MLSKALTFYHKANSALFSIQLSAWLIFWSWRKIRPRNPSLKWNVKLTTCKRRVEWKDVVPWKVSSWPTWRPSPKPPPQPPKLAMTSHNGRTSRVLRWHTFCPLRQRWGSRWIIRWETCRIRYTLSHLSFLRLWMKVISTYFRCNYFRWYLF